MITATGCATTRSLQSHSVTEIHHKATASDLIYGGMTWHGDLVLCLKGNYRNKTNTTYQVFIKHSDIINATESYKNTSRGLTLTPGEDDYSRECNYLKSDLKVELENNHGPTIKIPYPDKPYIHHVSYTYKRLETLKTIDNYWYVTDSNDTSLSLLGHVNIKIENNDYEYFKIRAIYIDEMQYDCAICLTALPLTLVIDLITLPIQGIYYLYQRAHSGH